MIRNMFQLSNLKHKIRSKTFPNLLDYYYNTKMDKKIKDELKKSDYDLIYSTRPMANYIVDLDIPKVIQPYDAVYKWHEEIYKVSKGIKKILHYVLYLMTKYYEKNVYNKFDACLVVTEIDKKFLKLLNPNINVQVISNGVNVEYFKPMETEEDSPSLIYVSVMSGSPTTENIFYFYDNILPLIRNKVPKIKLYLVGRDPVKEIKDLSSDPSIVITGFVEDVRPYLAKSSIFVAPMIMGTGIKNKVLEAMSMGKSIVSTEIGAQGINVVSGRDMFITNDEKEFADHVLILLKKKNLRNLLGSNARNIIKNYYSWEIIVEKLNDIFVEIVDEINDKNVK